MKTYHELIRHAGNQDLFTAVEMSIIALTNNYPLHIHAEGLRGTGKTTLMRAARELLPPIERIKGCRYNCDPAAPHCPEHRDLSPNEIQAIGTEIVPRPFLEISHNAKTGTVVGSIDLNQLTDRQSPSAALLPGTIPQAHRGILFIDEINRLADTSPELADILLDVMGTKPGRIQVEETGLPTVELPSLVSVWAASNPDEEPGALGQIRKQLADRFDLTIYMGRPADYQSVLNILKPSAAAASAPTVWTAADMDLGAVALSDQTRRLLAGVYVDFGLESLRALEALAKTASIRAMMAGRAEVGAEDIAKVVPMVLAHRTDAATIMNILRYLANTENQPVLPVNQYAFPTPANGQGAGAPAAAAGPNALARMWQNVKEWLSFRRKQPQAASTERSAAAPSAMDNRSLGGKSAGSSPSPQVLDPSAAEIIAPPNPARPLTDLSVDQFVNQEDTPPHA